MFLALSRCNDKYTVDINDCERQVEYVRLHEQRDSDERSIWIRYLSLTVKHGTVANMHRVGLEIEWEATRSSPYPWRIRLKVRTNREAFTGISTSDEVAGKVS